MAQDNDQTPDQVAAGAYPTPEQRDQGGLVDALRSRGTLPSGLASMMMPPQVGPNAGLGFGSGVLNAQAGINHYGNVQHSQNPYMDDMYRQSALQTRINEGQMHAAQEQMRLQDQMRSREAQQLNLSRQIMKDMIPTLPEGPAKDSMLKQYAGTVSKMTGSPLTADLVTALANQNLNKDDVNGILDDAAQGMNLTLISQRHPGIPPQKIQSIIQADPQTLMRIGADKTADRNARIAKDKVAGLDALQKEYPSIAGHPEMFGDFIAIHAKMNNGLPAEQGTDQSKAMAYAMAKENALNRVVAEESRKLENQVALHKLNAAVDLNNKLAIMPLEEAMRSRLADQNAQAAERRAQMQIDAQKAKVADLQEQKSRQSIIVGEQWLNSWKDLLKEMNDAGMLPKDGSVLSKYQAALNRGLAPNADVLRRFKELQGQSVGWARGFEGEIGARFKGAFAPDFELFSDPPTYSGSLAIIKRKEAQLNAIKADKPTLRGEVSPIGGPAPKLSDPNAMYKSLRDSGMTKEQAIAKMQEQGYNVGK